MKSFKFSDMAYSKNPYVQSSELCIFMFSNWGVKDGGRDGCCCCWRVSSIGDMVSGGRRVPQSLRTRSLRPPVVPPPHLNVTYQLPPLHDM